MAERIKGITIEFDGDVKGLKKALTSVNKNARQTNTALKEVNRALKLNPNNVTLLTQKQQLLKTRVGEVTDKLKIMKMRLEQMKNDPSVDKKGAEFQKLQREIIKAEAYQKQFAREMVRFGSARFNAVGGSLQALGSKLTNVTRRARQAAGALAAIALYKGFQRLKTLDDVSTELEKLGYKGKKLEQIMNDATASVSSTKFALTDMSKVAKGALGADVESKYGLADYLGRVADLSAVAGVGVDKMGALMNKALSKGTVDAKLLNQMNANGIPIYTLLAKELNTTTDEIMKLSRQGQISFDDLYRATNKYKGLAQELGTNTLSGAVTVLSQQFGLIGAEFLQGAYEPLKSGVKGIVAWLKELRANGSIKEWGNAVGETIKYFVEWFKNGEASVDGLSGKAQGLIAAFSPLVKFIGTLVKGFMELPNSVKGLAVAFGLFGGPLLTVIGGFVKLIGMVPAFMNLVSIVGGLGKAFTLLLGANPIILAIVAGIAALIAAGVLLYKNWDTIKAFAISIWNSIKNAVTVVINQIKTNFNTLKSALITIWNGIKSVASSVWNGIKNAMFNPVQSAFNLIKGIINKIKGLFPLSIGKLMKNIKLPHFSLSWGSKDFGKLGTIRYPKGFDVSWYKKGGIFDNPSIIGVGEAGAEAVVPLNKLWAKLDAIADASGGQTVINVYGSDNMDVNELAAAVEQRIITLQKRRTQAWA